MIAGEYLHARHFPEHTAKVLFGYTIPPWLWNAYEKVHISISQAYLSVSAKNFVLFLINIHEIDIKSYIRRLVYSVSVRLAPS